MSIPMSSELLLLLFIKRKIKKKVHVFHSFIILLVRLNLSATFQFTLLFIFFISLIWKFHNAISLHNRFVFLSMFALFICFFLGRLFSKILFYLNISNMDYLIIESIYLHVLLLQSISVKNHRV